MADLSDVEDALVALVSGVLYPNGTSQPSIVGAACKIYRGWPTQAELDAYLASKQLTVTVYPRPGTERNTTRFPRDWQPLVAPAPTLTATVVGNVVTLGGVVTPGNYVTVIVGDGIAYSYAALPDQTFDDVAAALQAIIQGDFPAAAAGATLTITTGLSIVARVGAPGQAAMEIRRQLRQFQITFWCADPASRDQASGLVDPVLAATDFLTLADGFAGRLLYVGTASFDTAQAQRLYRRDLIYSVEYPTTVTEAVYPITSITEGIQGSASPPDAPIIKTGI
jgi:hypothetical protein